MNRTLIEIVELVLISLIIFTFVASTDETNVFWVSSLVSNIGIVVE